MFIYLLLIRILTVCVTGECGLLENRFLTLNKTMIKTTIIMTPIIPPTIPPPITAALEPEDPA